MIKTELLDVSLIGLPPTVNQMYRNAGIRIRYKTEAVKEYQWDVINMLTQFRVGKAFSGRVAVQISFHVPAKSKRRWDIDNRLKVLLDCLQPAGIIKDDSQIDFITAERIFSQKIQTAEDAKTEIKVFGLSEEEEE